MSWYYKPYIPVAKRREQARKKIFKMQKQGKRIVPLEIHGKKIANTFWGKSWCSHIESFSDYTNRLPRGRTYVRNGSVCHLMLSKGKVNAIVSGSELYNVTITIKPITANKWEAIKKSCSGQINSILDLLAGKLSDGIMDMVCDKKQGLFPLSRDIELDCSCPDWATMCKHVAAVLYGVGTRLDSKPEELFILRGVNYEELIDVGQAVTDITRTKQGKSKRLSTSDTSKLFGVDLVDNTNTITPTKPKKKKSSPKKAQSNIPKTITGYSISKQRKALGLTKTALARQLGLSVTTITNWEAYKRKQVSATTRSIEKLHKLWS